MITPPVYRQKRSWPCADYAMLIACQRLGIDVSEDYMLSTNEIGIASVARTLARDKKIKGILGINTQAWVDFWLRQWHYIVSGVGKMSFDEVRNPPHISNLSGSKGHNFCIIAKQGYMYKIQDSQGERFADKWCWYIHEKYLRFLKKFRILP